MKHPFAECPKCGGGIVADDWESDDTQCWRVVYCSYCGFDWNEVYNFAFNETIGGNVHLDENGNEID